MGRELYDAVRQAGLLSRNEAYVNRTQRIFSQLLAVMPEKLYPYQCIVIADNRVNAQCAPGGYIMVFEGLLAKMPDDNQLAFVLGHEIGHGARRHTIRAMRKTQTSIATQAALSILFGTQFNSDAVFLDQLRFNRDHEREADAFGTELYLRAGFDPVAVADGMQTLAEMASGQSRGPDYLQTHPDPEKRVKSIKSTATDLLERGLEPTTARSIDLSVEQVFGKIPTIAPLPSEWIPQQPGTRWVYDATSKAGGVTSYEITVIGVATVAQTPIARIELDMGGVKSFYQQIVDEDRVFRRNRPTNTKSEWIIDFMVPELGTVEGDDNRKFHAVAVEDIETPAGSFKDCVKVVERSGDKTTTSWYAKGVGLVQRSSSSGLLEQLTRFSRGSDQVLRSVSVSWMDRGQL
jgi:hypothetical protein